MRLFFLERGGSSRFQSINSPKADWPPHWVVEPRLVDPRQGMPVERALLGKAQDFCPWEFWYTFVRHASESMCRSPRRASGVLSCHSPSYFLDVVPLTEPEASWWLTSCSGSPVSPSHNTDAHKVTSNLVYRFLDLNSCLHTCSLSAVTEWAASPDPGLDSF